LRSGLLFRSCALLWYLYNVAAGHVVLVVIRRLVLAGAVVV
jgi:hypothetical protein